MRIFPEPEVLLQQFEKRPELFTFYTSCANFSSLAFIVASESWCVKNNNNKNNKNNSKEGTAESVKGQRAVAPLTLIIFHLLPTGFRTFHFVSFFNVFFFSFLFLLFRFFSHHFVFVFLRFVFFVSFRYFSPCFLFVFLFFPFLFVSFRFFPFLSLQVPLYATPHPICFVPTLRIPLYMFCGCITFSVTTFSVVWSQPEMQ